MAKFRMLLDSKAGDHFSNAMGEAEALVAAARIRVIVGRPPDLIPDTRSLRRELAKLDREAGQIQAQIPANHPGNPITIAWSQPFPADAACDCATCGSVEISEVDQVHPEFAPPPLKDGFATLEEEEPVEECGDRTADSGVPPLPTLGEKRRAAWGMFVRGARRWSWRWPLVIPATFLLLVLASGLSLALEAFAWFVAKEPSL